MLVDKSELGFGKRSWRYSMLVRDGVVEKQFIEAEVEGDPFEVSDADTMIDYINPSVLNRICQYYYPARLPALCTGKGDDE